MTIHFKAIHELAAVTRDLPAEAAEYDIVLTAEQSREITAAFSTLLTAICRIAVLKEDEAWAASRIAREALHKV